MVKKTFSFSSARVDYYFDGGLTALRTITDKRQTVLLVDEHVFDLHQRRFNGWKTIVVPAGEEHKNQKTVDSLIGKLLSLEADRNTVLVGIGGGVVTDITGYVASVYMRGL